MGSVRERIMPERHVKLASSLLLLVTLGLPFGTCAHYVDRDGKAIWKSTATPGRCSKSRCDDGARPYCRYHRPPIALPLLAFIWSLLTATYWFRNPPRRAQIAITVLEPLLIVASACVFYFLFLLGGSVEASWGAYLAFPTLGAYTLAWLTQLLHTPPCRAVISLT